MEKKKFLNHFLERQHIQKLKKLVGETTPEDFEIMKEKVQKAADNSIKKKEKVIDYIKNNP